MTIEQEQEVNVEPEETNEVEEVAEEIVEEPVVERPVETPEAKRARLKRQLEQHDKKHGFKDEEVQPAPKGEMSTKDVLYLAKADIHEEDMEEVTSLAKAMFGGDVKKAHEYLKPRFAVKAEERKTAEATHTGTARRGSVKVTDEALLASAKAGKIPESDEEIERLVRAKASQKN